MGILSRRIRVHFLGGLLLAGLWQSCGGSADSTRELLPASANPSDVAIVNNQCSPQITLSNPVGQGITLIAARIFLTGVQSGAQVELTSTQSDISSAFGTTNLGVGATVAGPLPLDVSAILDSEVRGQCLIFGTTGTGTTREFLISFTCRR